MFITTHYIPKVTLQSTCTLYYLFISILAYFLVNTIIKMKTNIHFLSYLAQFSLE